MHRMCPSRVQICGLYQLCVVNAVVPTVTDVFAPMINFTAPSCMPDITHCNVSYFLSTSHLQFWLENRKFIGMLATMTFYLVPHEKFISKRSKFSILYKTMLLQSSQTPCVLWRRLSTHFFFSPY